MLSNKLLSHEADGQHGCIRLVSLGKQANRHPGNIYADNDTEIGFCTVSTPP